eukprot:NODE_1074_length_501_cov_249.508021_g1064_i0.p2 GENE.NODE_1074_length_501_cov_249.508021_g1064_i0~~NODE_1074_length_501_cov_249.508021_g1064_i0.p2  ORF type:complete len:76 (-),score=14.59 NODE_1074_length_501_cov_249.508021_g1064_i0:63-290(-)
MFTVVIVCFTAIIPISSSWPMYPCPPSFSPTSSPFEWNSWFHTIHLEYCNTTVTAVFVLKPMDYAVPPHQKQGEP